MRALTYEQMGYLLCRYIDRLADPCPSDPLERIVSALLADYNEMESRHVGHYCPVWNFDWVDPDDERMKSCLCTHVER